MNDPGDVSIIRRFLNGDEHAFYQLVLHWQKPVMNFLAKHMGNTDDARELAQETFKTIYEKLPSLKDHSRFRPWVYRVAINHCRMRLRKHAARHTDYLEDLGSADDENGGRHFPMAGRDDRPSPEEALSRLEMEQVVRQALARLHPKQREVVVLKEYTGLKFGEIAQVLDLPLSTVKSRMYLGLENLKAEILKIIEP